MMRGLLQHYGHSLQTSDSGQFNLKYNKDGLSSLDDVLKISKDKIYKISDHGKADDSDNLSMELIQKVN